MKQIKFTRTVFDNGFPKFKEGEVRPYSPDLERWARRGAAVVVEVADTKPADSKGDKKAADSKGDKA